MRAPRAKPHERTKAARRVLSPDEAWAAKISEAVLGDCHPFQRDAVEDPWRFITLLVGRGGGKTSVMRARALRKLTSIRDGALLYVAPTKPMAEKLMWRPLKKAIDIYAARGVLKAEEFSFNESKLECTCLRTGAILTLVGMDDQSEADKLRGQPFDEVYIDEAGVIKPTLLEELIDEAITPRLGERDGVIVMGGTPKRFMRGPFYDFTRPGACVVDDDGAAIPLHRPYADRVRPEFTDWDGWSSHYWTLKAVAELPDAATKYKALCKNWQDALREKKKKRWSDDHPKWKRERLAIWSADDTNAVFKYRAHLDDGAPWNQWNPFGDNKLEGVQALKAAIAALHKLGLKELMYVIAADMGSSAPFALNVFAFSASDPQQRIWHVFSFERTGMFGRTIAELILGPALDTDKPEGILGVIGWPDAWVMDTDGATLDDLQDKGLPFEKANRTPHYKHGAIQTVNGDLGDGRIIVLAGSPLEVQLQSLQWAEDRFGRVQEDPRQASHSTDTLVYGRMAILHLFDSGAVESDPDPKLATETYRPAQKPKEEISTPRVDDDSIGGGHDDGVGLLGESYDSGYTDIWGNGL